MTLDNDYLKCIKDSDSVFDLLSNCISVLDTKLNAPNMYTNLINEYIHDRTAKYYNALEWIFGLSKAFFDDFIEPYPEKKEKLLNSIDMISDDLIPDDKKEMFQLAIIYNILSGINTDAYLWEERKIIKNLGPLDNMEKNRCRVYWRPQYSSVDQYASGVGRIREKNDDVKNDFDHFFFLNEDLLQSNGWYTFPRGQWIRSDLHKPKERVRIGVSPLCIKKNFEFMMNKANNTYTIEYPNRIDQIEFEKMIEKIFMRAVSNECDILVFPEYICNEKLLSKLKELIRTHKKDRKTVPLLTLAGTRWTENNENLLYMIDSFGNEVGRYYKKCPFVDKKTGMREALKNPGDRCDFVAIEGIGIILPSVCRDIVNPNGTEFLAQIINPVFTTVSAWSRSVSSMKRDLITISEKYFTSSIISNACSAKNGLDCDEKITEKIVSIKNIGYGCIVHKNVEEKVAGALPKPVTPDGCNVNDCHEGCLFIAEYDFRYKAGKRKNDPPRRNTHLYIHKA